MFGVLIVVLSSFRRSKKRNPGIRGIPGILIGSAVMMLPFLFLEKSFYVATDTAIYAMNYECATDVLESCVEEGSLDASLVHFNDQVDVEDEEIDEFCDSISELDMSHCYVT